jgi:hypothetical protein
MIIFDPYAYSTLKILDIDAALDQGR